MNDETISRVFQALNQSNLTIATAESCTGGLLATYLSELAGSSKFFLGGVASYSDAAKITILRLDPELLKAKGAVSGEVAEAMAVGVKNLLGSDISVSLTGVAGPSGASPDKPIGTVWCGLASQGKSERILFQFLGDRKAIREQAAEAALEAIFSLLKGLQ